MSNPIPGYLTTRYENGSYTGGLIITDKYAIPIDFKYTAPQTPTDEQRLIYGLSLERYVRDHVIVGALIKEVTSPPSFYVVSQHELFELEETTKLSLMSLQRTQFPAIGEKGTINRAKDNECLVQSWMDPHPVRVIFGQASVELQEEMLKDLVFLAKTMDITEPLERLEKALKVFGQEKH